MRPSTDVGTASPNTALNGFQAHLVDRGLVSRANLAVAEPYAVGAHLELADALVALGLVSEADSYAALATAEGADLVALDGVASSVLAVQLVPEKLARRHLVVPLQVDNRTLTYATCRPFSAEAETDLGFASGRRMKLVIATRAAVLKALDRCYPRLGELDVLAKRLLSGRSATSGSKPATGKTASPIEMCNDIIGCAGSHRRRRRVHRAPGPWRDHSLPRGRRVSVDADVAQLQSRSRSPISSRSWPASAWPCAIGRRKAHSRFR